ncbi:MAG: hypothetical protein WCL44_03840 [bacterium]
MPPSRALSNKSGDQKSRAELLGKLLVAAGEKPYILTHGTDRSAYFLVLAAVTEDEVKSWTSSLTNAPTIIALGPVRALPLQLEKDSPIGTISKRLYDTGGGGWTATIAITRFK